MCALLPGVQALTALSGCAHVQTKLRSGGEGRFTFLRVVGGIALRTFTWTLGTNVLFHAGLPTTSKLFILFYLEGRTTKSDELC